MYTNTLTVKLVLNKFYVFMQSSKIIIQMCCRAATARNLNMAAILEAILN